MLHPEKGKGSSTEPRYSPSPAPHTWSPRPSPSLGQPVEGVGTGTLRPPSTRPSCPLSAACRCQAIRISRALLGCALDPSSVFFLPLLLVSLQMSPPQRSPPWLPRSLFSPEAFSVLCGPQCWGYRGSCRLSSFSLFLRETERRAPRILGGVPGTCPCP